MKFITMPGATVKARRVTEPTLVQRHPIQLDNNEPLSELTTAWNNITEAKTALYRAEARLEHSENAHPAKDPRSAGTSSQLMQRHPANGPLPVDSVPSMEIKSNPASKAIFGQKRLSHQPEKPRKRVTIRDDERQSRRTNLHASDQTSNALPLQRDDSNLLNDITKDAVTSHGTVDSLLNPSRVTSSTALTDLPGASSSRDILGNGPANLSVENSSEVRVLNDNLSPSLVRQSSTVEVSPGLRVSKDYIPAYDRLFGDKPILKLSDRESVGPGLTNTPENRKLLSLISSSQKPRDTSVLGHMERLRERIQQQRMSASREQDQSIESQRRRHQESDPVMINSEAERTYLFGAYVAPKVPVRKVASAPAAPAYRGFNQVETRFQVADGRIVMEDQLKRKTSRQNVRTREQVPAQNQLITSTVNATGKPLQPSQRQMHDNHGNSKALVSRVHQKPVRKVKKATLPNAKPRKPEMATSVSVSAWREGQKTVLKMLGPPPQHAAKQASHLPQARDPKSDNTQDSHVIPEAARPRSEDEAASLSEHPIESDNEREEQPPSSQPDNVAHLPEEAQGILNDLHLDEPEDKEKELPTVPAGSKASKVNNNVPQMSRKKKVSRSKSKEPSSSSAPVQKVRHIDAEEVQKYMAKQRAERRKRMQDDKRQKTLQAEKKKEQLQELYKRQRESAKTAPPRVGMPGPAVARQDQVPLDQTFSRGPESSHPQLNRPSSLQRQHPYQQATRRKIDMTGSDKENRAFWSTSSSDSSLRSSPQTDVSDTTHPGAAPGLAPAGAHQVHHDGMVGGEGGGGRDIVLEPVREEELPSASSVVIRNQLNDDGSTLHPEASAGTGPNLERPAARRPNIPAKPRGNADRIAAIRATAAALQGRLENEVRQLTGDLTNMAANMLSSSPSNQGAGSMKSPSSDRWAYPMAGPFAPASAPLPVTSTPSQVTRPVVRFSMPPSSPQGKVPAQLTKHQKVTGADKDFDVFVGLLPGVTNLDQQARNTADGQAKMEAATTIQAAFRGHQVRQKMRWDLPSGFSLADRIHGKKDEASIPQVPLSTLARPSPPASFSNQDGLQSDGESLSEGPLSDESSGAEVDQEYTPKFKSLPTRAQANLHHPPDNRQTNINFSLGHRTHEPQRDGLSVIDIYMKRYQESQKELQTRQKQQQQARDKSPARPQSTQRVRSPGAYSYSEDFLSGDSQPLTLSQASSIPHSQLLDSPAYSRTIGHSPIPSSASADNIHASQLSRPSSKDSNVSRPPTGRSFSVPSPGRDDTSKSLSVIEKKRSRTPSPRPHSLRDAGTQTPPSSRSSPASVKSRSSGSRGSRSPHSETRSPVDEIRSLIEDLKKSTSNADSLPLDSARSGMPSPASRSSQGQGQDTSRHSSSARSPLESPTSPHQGVQGASAALPGTGGRNAKSPVTREVLTHFKPISRPGSEVASSRSSSSILTSAISQPGPKFYSPSALQLKMAAELNLLDILEESVRQVSEVERSRAVALAQQESSSLAKILQAKQLDHEKEINLLSLKAKQEVEAANRQFDAMKHRNAEVAMEVEQIRVAAKKEAAAETRDSAQRLLQTQAEAAKTTAEAAKQLAEAHKASVIKPPPAPAPQVDPGQVASETAMAAASAAVTAALEQQRLHQRDLLQELRASLQPPPPVTRSVAAGDSRATSVTPSRSADSKTLSGHYSEDFTNTSSATSTHTITSPSRSPLDSPMSSPVIVDGAGDSSASKSIKTASSISMERPGLDHSDSIASASDLVLDKDHSRSATISSIRTDSAARAASTKDSISEEVIGGANSPSHQYSNSYEDSASDSEHSSSVRSVLSPTPTPTPRRPDGKKDVRSVLRHGITGTVVSTPKDKHDLLGNSRLTEQDESLSVVKIEMIQKQLKEEEARSQQQVTLLKLREKVLVDKTNAELEWLEHQKRRQKEKGDQEEVASLRKRQRALLAKLQSEQAEIKRLLSIEKQSTMERQRMLHQQQEIARLRKVAVRYKDQMRDLPNVSPSTSSINADADDDDDVDNLLGSSLDSFSDMSPITGGAALPISPMDASALEKQAKVMQKLKMMQQPFSTNFLMKREMKLKKRRKNAEELLAWKQRLDEEEKRVVNMEHKVLTLWDGPRGKTKVVTSPSKGERTKAEPKGREADEYSSASSSLPTHHDAMSYGTHSDEYSYKSDILSVSSRTKSESQRSNMKSPPSDRRPRSSSSASVAEDIESRNNSSIAEDIASSDKTPTAKGSSESHHAVGEISSDDTIKEASGLQEYGSDSFDSTADQTLTPSKPGTLSASATRSVGGRSPVGMASPPAPASVVPTSSTPKSITSGTPSSRRSPFVPHHRVRHPSDSGSESEKSFSQTMSETASDQSDIEGRVRALKDALKRRKMEADRLRKQQKRMSREKLKAQEASLKKQLETYENIIETTKAELDNESQKQKQPASGQQMLLTPTAKPQIKQPKAGSDSLRHARALRQRTASDSSQEGGLSERRSTASTARGRSGSESGRSSRSSLEGVGEELVIGQVPSAGSRDVSYSSISATSTPRTHHSEGGVSPKSPHSISRDRSRSAGSSIAEDISIRSDYSDRESFHDSEKFDSKDHQKIKEKLHREQPVDMSEKEEEDRLSISPIVGTRRSGDGKDADESVPQVGPVIPVVPNRPASQHLVEKDDDVTDKDISISSSVPEDIISAASIQSRDSFEESRSAAYLITNSPKSDHRLSLDDKEGESSFRSVHSPARSPLHSPARSPAAERRTVTPDDISQQSMKSISSSVHSQSTSHASSRSQSVRSSRSQSVKSVDSYSEDTFESSVASKEKESKSDTDEDISEELSEASEVSVAKSSPSQASGMLVFDLKGKAEDKQDKVAFDLKDKQDEVSFDRVGKSEGLVFDLKDKAEDLTEQAEPGLGGETPEITVSPKEKEDIVGDAEQEEEVLPDFAIGDRVLIGGTQPGTLRFKGLTHFASGVWAGVELDKPLGTNDGRIKGVFYFSCKPNFGIFAPVDKVAHPPTTLATPVTTPQEEEASDHSSIEEEIPSESSIRMVSESDQIKSMGIAKEPLSKDDDLLSENSVSIAPLIKSEEAPVGATDDEMSEVGIDDDALEKLISNAAEAVESFSHDEPGYAHPALDTPRGAPEDEIPHVEELPLEDTEEGEREEAEAMMVDSITDHLTEIVVKDTLDAVLEVASKQRQEEEENHRSKESLLQLLVSAESPRSEGEVIEELDEKPEIVEKEQHERTENKAETLTKSLMNDAIDELLKLRKQRNTKILYANETLRKREEENKTAEQSKTPEDALSPPELRAETPYTPDKSPERRIDSVSPLDDDIFINRVRVESSLSSDSVPIARPGSPVFGESGTVSPEALSEKLQQLQLDKDILEADLFGDEEWFDDEFGSMKKSQSIIKVPERSVSPPKLEAVSAPDSKVAKMQAKLDLKKIVEEPFYAVPHNVKELKNLANKSVAVFHEKVLTKEPSTELVPPAEIMGSDTKGSDIESTSRKAYKNLVFALSGEVYHAINREHEPTVQPPWMKPKRKPRRFFFQQPPRNQSEMTNAVEDRVLSLTGLVPKPRQETALAGSNLSKKKDHVDEILIDELKEEEPEWIDYDNDELSVKMQQADDLFEVLLVDTAMVLHQIMDKRKAKRSRDDSR